MCFSRENCAAGRHSARMSMKERTEETVQTRTTYAGAAQSLHEADVERKRTDREGKGDRRERKTTHGKI